MITTASWPGSSVVQAAIERPTAMRLAQTEYQRATDVVDALRSEDRTQPTDCTAWDVRQLVAHIVVAEWARRHSQPYRLQLTGPAGSSWSSGTDGEEIVMDTADFCRVISGRPGTDVGQPSGLLTTQVPF